MRSQCCSQPQVSQNHCMHTVTTHTLRNASNESVCRRTVSPHSTLCMIVCSALHDVSPAITISKKNILTRGVVYIINCGPELERAMIEFINFVPSISTNANKKSLVLAHFGCIYKNLDIQPNFYSTFHSIIIIVKRPNKTWILSSESPQAVKV